MSWFQKEIVLAPRPRGFHLITREILAAVPEIALYKLGLAHVFIRHTSAALALNENVDPTVRADMEAYFNRLAPENAPYYKHTIEGPDDMPAHLKAVLLGSSLTIPISDGRLALGTWQGVYLCEHRDDGGQRRLIITLTGDTDSVGNRQRAALC
ncbi:MAG: secondary thiamine-phosphate synthase enzyme YjbQ [Candidatus Promineofilum sp.]|nr:secondary thiamine-phosphate synthase enzyme YjbQ [Promineifilum sp.]